MEKPYLIDCLYMYKHVYTVVTFLNEDKYNYTKYCFLLNVFSQKSAC